MPTPNFSTVRIAVFGAFLVTQQAIRGMLPKGRAAIFARAAHPLALCLVVLAPVALATGDAAPPSALAKLAQTGEASCQPALPYFCGNVHVSCSGRTLLRTFPFTLRANRTRGAIESEPDPEHEVLRTPYDDSHVEWEEGGASVILRPRGDNNGYIKLLADGSYSFRHYTPHGAVMSIGRCR